MIVFCLVSVTMSNLGVRVSVGFRVRVWFGFRVRVRVRVEFRVGLSLVCNID